jgi:hypothetical protein
VNTKSRHQFDPGLTIGLRPQFGLELDQGLSALDSVLGAGTHTLGVDGGRGLR